MNSWIIKSSNKEWLNDQQRLELLTHELSAVKNLEQEGWQWINLPNGPSQNNLDAIAVSGKKVLKFELKFHQLNKEDRDPYFSIYEDFADILYRSHRSEQYRKKYTDYKRLIRYLKSYTEKVFDLTQPQNLPLNIEEQLDTPVNQYLDRYYNFYSRIDSYFEITGSTDSGRKIELIETLIRYADILSQNYDEQLEKVFIHLEGQLQTYLNTEDRQILNASGIWDSDASILDIYIKRLRLNILHLKRKMFCKCSRDIRMFFRRIVHFLFKNMDDESDAVNQLHKVNDSNSINIKIHFPWITKKLSTNLSPY